MPNGSMIPQGSPQLPGSQSQPSPMNSHSRAKMGNRGARGQNNQMLYESLDPERSPQLPGSPSQPSPINSHSRANMENRAARDMDNEIFKMLYELLEPERSPQLPGSPSQPSPMNSHSRAKMGNRGARGQNKQIFNKLNDLLNPQGSPQVPGSPSQPSPINSHSRANMENHGSRNQNNEQQRRRPFLRELLDGSFPEEVGLDPDSQKMFEQIADDFINATLTAGLAQGGRARRVELREIHQQLERCWIKWIPGYRSDEGRPIVRAAPQRLTVPATPQRPKTIIRKFNN